MKTIVKAPVGAAYGDCVVWTMNDTVKAPRSSVVNLKYAAICTGNEERTISEEQWSQERGSTRERGEPIAVEFDDIDNLCRQFGI